VTSPQPTAFLDRDGTIIVERDYLGDPDGVMLEAGAAEGLRALANAGFRLVVVSNQSGVARGKLTIGQVEAVNARVDQLLAAEGVKIDRWYYCPHGPDDGCDCRKPLPGMIDQAASDLEIDFIHSIVVGDKESDVALAATRGMVGYMVLTGHGREHEDFARRAGHIVCRDLLKVSQVVSPPSARSHSA
jgi:histidinol-phosphate phosphatase family protein